MTAKITYDSLEVAALTDVPIRTVYAIAREGRTLRVGDVVIRPLHVGRAVRWPKVPIDKALGIAETDTEAVAS
jgi:hypothetical protein